MNKKWSAIVSTNRVSLDATKEVGFALPALDPLVLALVLAVYYGHVAATRTRLDVIRFVIFCR